jgi:hypothetical protein
MQKNIFRIIFLIFAVLIISSCSKDNSSPTSPDLVIDQALVGTWELTQITSPIVTTPQTLGLALTAVFTSDSKVEFTTIQNDSTSIDTGTWGTKDGSLTITLEGGDPATSTYTVNGNTATIDKFPVSYQNSIILAGLEFTKQ